jgi:hypothetical protein
MFEMSKPILISIILVLSSSMVISQPVSVSLLNESTAIPYTRFITTPIHPGIQFGTETDLKQYTNTRLFFALHIGYYYHKSFAQGIYIKPSLGFEYRHSSGFAVAGSLGLGYLHTFTTQEEYRLENGSYIKQKDSGNARIMPSLGLTLNYYLKPDNIQSPKIFFGYESWIEYPFSPGFIPLMTHVTTQLGVQFYPFENHKNNE